MIYAVRNDYKETHGTYASDACSQRAGGRATWQVMLRRRNDQIDPDPEDGHQVGNEDARRVSERTSRLYKANPLIDLQ